MLKNANHLTNFARENRKAGNPAEKALWCALKPMRARGLAWRKQHPIESYVVDFCCLRARVVVEIDGESHDSREDYDRRRDADLISQGFEVLHYGHRQALENPSGIAEFLEIHCGERAKLLFGEDYARRRDTSHPTLP